MPLAIGFSPPAERSNDGRRAFRRCRCTQVEAPFRQPGEAIRESGLPSRWGAHGPRTGCSPETGLSPWADPALDSDLNREDQRGLPIGPPFLQHEKDHRTEPQRKNHPMQLPRPIPRQHRTRQTLTAPNAFRAKNPPTTHARATSCGRLTGLPVR
jgi:hypothetical protein